jgi:hypothetical protein
LTGLPAKQGRHRQVRERYPVEGQWRPDPGVPEMLMYVVATSTVVVFDRSTSLYGPSSTLTKGYLSIHDS